MILYYPLSIDLYQPYPLPVVQAQQNNVGRGVIITLLAQGQMIELTTEIVNIYVKRPDGFISYLPCTVSGSTIQVQFTNQMLLIPGIAQAELQIIEEDPSTEITTPIFQVKINPSNIDNEVVEGSNEFTALSEALQEVQDLKENGLKGDAGTIEIGTVTTGQPGTAASVENVGTDSSAILNFTIPQGVQGPEGPAGQQEVVFGALSTFPTPGNPDMIYVDNTVSPALIYNWNNNDNAYEIIGSNSTEIINAVYPVGSIYMSVTNTNPQTLFGGTWEQLKDRFLLGAGDTYDNGDTGGAATVSLTAAQNGPHTHSLSGNNIMVFTGSGNVGNPGTQLVGNSSITTGSSGSGQAHNNMPPYLVVYMWKRTA